MNPMALAAALRAIARPGRRWANPIVVVMEREGAAMRVAFAPTTRTTRAVVGMLVAR